MTITAKRLAQALLGATPAPVYTVPTAPAGTFGIVKALMKDISAANAGDSPASVRLYIVPAGAQPGPENIFFPGVTVQPGGLAGWNGTQVLEAGDVLYACGAGATLTISGAEVQ